MNTNDPPQPSSPSLPSPKRPFAPDRLQQLFEGVLKSRRMVKPADVETRWEEVVALRDPEKQKQAVRALLDRYGEVILWRISLEQRPPREEVMDVFHDFVAWVLKKNPFAKAEQSRGKFRKYLHTKMNGFLVDRYRYRQVGKRDGKAVHVALEYVESELVGGEAPDEAVYDRRWALALIRQAIERVKRENLDDEDYADLHAMSNAELWDKATSRGYAGLRKLLQQAVREEVKLTSITGLLDEELKYLADVMAGMSGAFLAETEEVARA